MILDILEKRFNETNYLENAITWEKIDKALKSNPHALKALENMESTAGEPNIIKYDNKKKTILIADCYKESPSERCNCTYDRNGEEKRIKKGIHPNGNALDRCNKMGTTLMNEEQYRHLQSLDDFDLKTSCWLLTPNSIHSLGGAIFGDKRYNHTFIYHNGAQSFYSSRGFRSVIELTVE